MTPHIHVTDPDHGDPMTDINDRTRITLPMVLTVGGVIVGAILWANSLNVAVAEVKKDQSNDRERLQRIEASIDRVEAKVDSMKDALRTQPQNQRSNETDYGVRKFDR